MVMFLLAKVKVCFISLPELLHFYRPAFLPSPLRLSARDAHGVRLYH